MFQYVLGLLRLLQVQGMVVNKLVPLWVELHWELVLLHSPDFGVIQMLVAKPQTVLNQLVVAIKN
jgi:hypothetical protein